MYRAYYMFSFKETLCIAGIVIGGWIFAKNFPCKVTTNGEVREFLRMPQTQTVGMWLGDRPANCILPENFSLAESTQSLNDGTALCLIASATFHEAIESCDPTSEQQQLRHMVQHVLLFYAQLISGNSQPLGLGGWCDLIKKNKRLLRPVLLDHYPRVATLLT